MSIEGSHGAGGVGPIEQGGPAGENPIGETFKSAKLADRETVLNELNNLVPSTEMGTVSFGGALEGQQITPEMTMQLATMMREAARAQQFGRG